MQSACKRKEVVSLWRSYRETREAGHSEIRYYLMVESQRGQDAAIRVFDCARDCFLVDWQGPKVHQLLKSDLLPADSRYSGCYACDKSFVWHLILVVAAAQMALDQMDRLDADSNEYSLYPPYPRPYLAPVRTATQANTRARSGSLADRLKRLGLCLTGPHKRVARMLFAHPGHHFSIDDVRCLLLLECPPVADRQASSWLDDLARWRVIQRVEVDGKNIFYCTNTMPHEHIFDPRTREFRDADKHGMYLSIS